MSIEERKDQIGAAPDTSEPRRFCRKCLTREMEQTEYFRTLHEYIEHLDADLKVDNEVYEERLALCKECEKLYQGMCRICGCYVDGHKEKKLEMREAFLSLPDEEMFNVAY